LETREEQSKVLALEDRHSDDDSDVYVQTNVTEVASEPNSSLTATFGKQEKQLQYN